MGAPNQPILQSFLERKRKDQFIHSTHLRGTQSAHGESLTKGSLAKCPESLLHAPGGVFPSSRLVKASGFHYTFISTLEPHGKEVNFFPVPAIPGRKNPPIPPCIFETKFHVVKVNISIAV